MAGFHSPERNIWKVAAYQLAAERRHISSSRFLYGAVRFAAILLKFNWTLTCGKIYQLITKPTYEFGIGHEFATLNIRRGKRGTPRDEI